MTQAQFPEIVPRLESYAHMRTWRERKGRYRLIGSVCKECGEKWFPPRKGLVCPSCHSENLEDYQCAKTGEVLTVQHEVMGYPAMGYGELSPRKIVMIKLDDGIHVLSEVTDCLPDDVSPGVRVKAVFRKQKREDTGCWMYGFKFILDKSTK